jgi:methionyl-tRNA synthetase
MARKLFVTTALPYANGPFHIGHIMEYIQADIWVRFQRMQGNEVLFVGADDAHGAPIMLKAQEEGITPQALVARIATGRAQYLRGFHLGFDHWYSTDSVENTELSRDIYQKLKKAGLIYVKPVEQFYDPVKGMFLADRYIKGECPNCHTKDQYADACEVCSIVNSPADLINPYSTLSGAKPVLKTSDHFFFKLSEPKCVEFLAAWLETPDRLQSQVVNKAREWLTGKGDEALGDWDISRDAPYFGIPIPDAPGKYFYVWLDAPVGYLASLKNYFDTGGARVQGETRTFEQFLTAPDTEQIHFIGKDIIYFHTLFWPAMLKFAGAPYRTPSHVYVHGFITVSGEKMSKSRGTGISPLRYLELGMNAEWLRYYIAAKLNGNVEDIDFEPDDFVARVNSDLIGKYVNIASRCAGFISKRFAGKLSRPHDTAEALLRKLQSSEQSWAPIGRLYANREYGKALREISNLLDQINQYIDEHKPWELAKLPANDSKLHEVCSTALAMFWYTSILLSPVLPATTVKVREFLNLSPEQMKWGQHAFFPAGHVINPYSHLMTRVDPKQLDALFDAGKDAAPAAPTATAKLAAAASASVAAPKAAPGAAGAAAPTAAGTTAPAARISIDEFLRIDLRVAKVLDAQLITGADKLLKLRLDVGELGEREIFAGIRSAYDPVSLVGRLIVMVANLEPRKMRFGTSEGMMLAAGPGGADIFVLSPDTGAAPGMRVK